VRIDITGIARSGDELELSPIRGGMDGVAAGLRWAGNWAVRRKRKGAGQANLVAAREKGKQAGTRESGQSQAFNLHFFSIF
jgi:hypothetical protein